MDGYIQALERRLKALELHIFGPATDELGHDAPAQTLAPSRQPITPGAPIANYDPTVEQDDDTDAAIAAETEWKNAPKRPFIPPVDDPYPVTEDPTLNDDGSTKRRRRATVDGDVT